MSAGSVRTGRSVGSACMSSRGSRSIPGPPGPPGTTGDDSRARRGPPPGCVVHVPLALHRGCSISVLVLHAVVCRRRPADAAGRVVGPWPCVPRAEALRVAAPTG
jgi:hypothetical protein